MRVLFDVILILCGLCGSNSVVPEYEITALHALYNNTVGDAWLWRNTTIYGPKVIFIYYDTI
jgi:hypothetical protein